MSDRIASSVSEPVGLVGLGISEMNTSVARLRAEADGGLVDGAMRAIIGRLRGGRLRIGDPIPSEASLAAELGVSRTVVREALRALATLGVIDLGNGRRARVGAIDKDVLGLVLDHAVHTDQATIQQIYDVRRTIEMRTVALAALRRLDSEAKAICAHAMAMRAAFSHPNEVMEHDIAFHSAIAIASRNPLFALIVGSFSVVTRQTWRIGWESRPTDAERMANLECHARIAAAIDAREPRVAEAAMAEHFDNSVRALLSAGVV